ncbi:tetratricopeptide repeat protein [Myroides sp. DW712]|uniref:tetratricopeptide repeat protein n=1 Tax=Myroides sp. DW712 TaxID=3389800 RepID=UPI00397C8355
MKFKGGNLLLWMCFLLLGVEGWSQETISTTLSCPTENQEILQLYKMGFSALEKEEYHNTAGRIFFQIIQMDKQLCDAYYYTGVSLTKQDKEDVAYTYLYYADSLASQPMLSFKVALAASALRIGNIGLARKKYEEVKESFPDSPEGYYGLSLTATSIGDVVEGLVNTDRTLLKYKHAGGLTPAREQEIYLIKAILLRMNTQYDKAIEFFEKSKEHFGHTTDYLANYAMTAYELYKQKKEEQWKQASQQALLRIEDKTALNDDFFEQFIYE